MNNERLNQNRDAWEEPPRDFEMERVEDGEDREEQRISTRDLADGRAGDARAARDARARDEEDFDRQEMNSLQPSEGQTTNTTPLFETGEAESFRSRWMDIQTQFVDEPQRSVEQADELVATTMKRLAEVFANERETLEKNWDRGGDISTEDLRLALQKYRSFFDRLLSV